MQLPELSFIVVCCKMSEKLCLKWNDFQENVNEAFGSLRGDKDFSDVTLACEDGQQFEAHKVILAASSPSLRHLLKANKGQTVLQNGLIFGKVPKGGGVIFNPKIYIAKFGPLNRAFSASK